MLWRINILFLVLILLSCQNKEIEINNSVTNDYLIEAKDLKIIINKDSIKVLDFRKKEFYNTEHIVGSQHIWRTDIEDSTYPYKGIMPSKAQVEALFGKLGIKTSDTIIVYDDNGLCEASRLWWILQNYGFENIKMLQGGIEAWKSINGRVTNEVRNVKLTEFKLPINSKMNYYVSKEEVISALNTNIVFVDTRSIDEFSGKEQKKGATKAGRLPNSHHLDWSEAVNYNGNMHLKPLEDLENIYNKLNITKETPLIVYCHSGVRSAHTTFVLTQLLGYKNVKNYDGSWNEWSYYDNLPYEKDSITLRKK